MDITSFVMEGTNTLRLIHLADLSDYVFVVHAAAPNAEDVARAGLRMKNRAFVDLVATKAESNGASFVFPLPASASTATRPSHSPASPVP